MAKRQRYPMPPPCQNCDAPLGPKNKEIGCERCGTTIQCQACPKQRKLCKPCDEAVNGIEDK